MKNLLVVCLLFLCCQFAEAQKISEKDVPASVKSTVVAKSKGHNVSTWVFDKNERKYIAAIISEQEVFTIETDVNGKWESTTYSLQESSLPALVKSTLQTNFLSKGYENLNYYFIEDAAGSYYAADLSSDDEDIYVTIDKNGKLLSKEAR